ncbi:MAG: DUF4236 domain-containing protein [Cyanobacteriota bacterium]
MAFRFRRSARIGPLRLHFGRGGLSSISLGGPGASLNLPVGRRGGPRTTVGLPGSGMSWSQDWSKEPERRQPAGAAAGLPNSRRLRAGQLDDFRRSCQELLRRNLFESEGAGPRLWEGRLVSRLLTDPSLGARLRSQLALIETPEAMEAYLQRATSQDDVKRRAHRCLEAVATAHQLALSRGWLKA